MTYAAGTKVQVASSHAEILRLLAKHGATDYGVAAQADAATLGFTIKGARVRLRFPMPTHADKDKPWSIRGDWDSTLRDFGPFDPVKHASRIDRSRALKLEQGTRERWRLVVLVLKTKLELVALGARTIEQEFLDGLVLPNGQTVGQALVDVFSLPPATLALPPGPAPAS